MGSLFIKHCRFLALKRILKHFMKRKLINGQPGMKSDFKHFQESNFYLIKPFNFRLNSDKNVQGSDTTGAA